MTAALDGRVAVVTGASRGIGREIALGLAADGARVGLVARSQEQLDATVQQIADAGGSAFAVAADVARPSRRREALAAVRERLGPVEVLINNAAAVGPLGRTGGLADDDVLDAMAIDLLAPIMLDAAVMDDMIAAGWGRIVNISSAVVAKLGVMTGMNVYATAKAAVEAHTINLAGELDGTGVTANVYRPGSVDTAMQAGIREQDREHIGSALHDYFTSSYAEGSLLTPAASAAGLLDRIGGDENGRIWDVADAA